MATWATTFWPPSAVLRARSEQPTAATAVADTNPLTLTGLPNDDVYFYCKRIDNSRLVRQSEPKAKGEWSAIAGTFAAALMVAAMLIAPGVKSVMDSYKIQDLRHEQAQLRNERRKLDVEQERMINAAKLDTLASEHHLVRPGADQVIRLQPKNNHSFAMNGFKH
jgi:hypothetical protein